MATIIDSYSESNSNYNWSVTGYSAQGRTNEVGQSFIGNGRVLNYVDFFIRKENDPTGNITARIYAHTGVFGTSSKPTGAILAESNPVDIATLSGTIFSLVSFTFSGANNIKLIDGTYYIVSIYYNDPSNVDKFIVSADSTGEHHGNLCHHSTTSLTWESLSTFDLIFYVYAFDYIEPEINGWTRISLTTNVLKNTYHLRAILSTSGTLAKFDDGQLEKSATITPIEEDFVGDLILPKRVIRSEVGFADNNIPKFTGLVNKFVPNIKSDVMQVYAYDLADRLKDILIEDKYYENKRSDELIQELASLAGIGIEQLTLETGTNTVEFAYFQEGSIWTYMNQVAEAEGGRVFFDETGRLNFWNRTHFRDNVDVKYTFDFDSDMMDLKYDISKEKTKNRIYVKAYPKKKLINVRIYNDTSVLSIGPGETQEFFCQYNYLQEVSVPALNVQIPGIGTDIIANTNEGGTGSNISSSISISSYSIFRESMRINLRNENASTAYLTRFRIYGDPIVIARRIEIIKEDTNAQAIYNVQELQIENNLITSDAFAETLAVQKLAELKDPRDFITIDVVGVPYLQLGDMVSVQCSYAGEYKNFCIVKNSWSFKDDFIQTLDLEKKVIT